MNTHCLKNFINNGCIDIHTHIVPENFPSYVGKNVDVPWPSMINHDCDHRHIIIRDKIYRTLSKQCWDLDARKADMDKNGINLQVLSPMPELFSYWMDASDAAILCRYINDTIANMVSRAPDRFIGLGIVPLQDIDLAVREIEYIIKILKFPGVEVGTNVNGVPIGDKRLKPFFKFCVDMNASIFVHPIRPSGLDRIIDPNVFEQIIAFPGEIGLSIASILTSGLMVDFPELRIAFSHGGGSFIALLPRMQKAWETFSFVKEMMYESPKDIARRLYYDDLLYDNKVINCLIEMVGETQVMVGTDYPFAMKDLIPVDRISLFDDSLSKALCKNNAMKWLNL